MALSKEQKRGRREILWLFALFLLIVVPLGIYTRIRTVKEEQEQKRKARLKAKMAADEVALKRLIAEPNVNSSPWFRPLKSGPKGNGYTLEGVNITLALSPNGKYLAGVLPYHSKTTTTPVISSHTPAKLVIWEADTKRELVRLPILEEASRNLQWSGNDIVTNSSTYGQVWRWKQRKLLSPVVTDDPVGNEHWSDVNTQATQIDPVRDIKVHMEYDGTLAAFRASTGKPIPFKVPAELTAEKLNGTDWVLVDEPANGPLFLISSTRFEKQKAKGTSPNRAPSPTPTSQTLPNNYGHVVAWDGRTGKVLWRRDFKMYFFGPSLSISPDRAIVAILGTWRPRREEIAFGEERGIEFLDAATGKTLSSATTNSDLTRFAQALWLPGNILSVTDSYAPNKTALSFFSAQTGKLEKMWPLQALADDDAPKPSYLSTPRDIPQAWTCEPTGQKWIFASPWGGWRKWTRTEIETRVRRYRSAPPPK